MCSQVRSSANSNKSNITSFKDQVRNPEITKDSLPVTEINTLDQVAAKNAQLLFP
jgi:hypothetical protein